MLVIGKLTKTFHTKLQYNVLKTPTNFSLCTGTLCKSAADYLTKSTYLNLKIRILSSGSSLSTVCLFM